MHMGSILFFTFLTPHKTYNVLDIPVSPVVKLVAIEMTLPTVLFALMIT